MIIPTNINPLYTEPSDDIWMIEVLDNIQPFLRNFLLHKWKDNGRQIYESKYFGHMHNQILTRYELILSCLSLIKITKLAYIEE